MTPLCIQLAVMPGTYSPMVSNRWPTVALAYLSSMARMEGCVVSVLDAHLDAASIEDVMSWLRKGSADIVGFSVPSEIVWKRTRRVLDLLSAEESLKGAWVVAGGMDASLRTSQILREGDRLDALAVGEGDLTWRDLIRTRRRLGPVRPLPRLPGLWTRARDGAFHFGGVRPAMTDLDTLPLPDYRFARRAAREGYLEAVGVSSSRGCPSRCRFCCIHPHWRRSGTATWRSHGAGYVSRIVGDVLKAFPDTPLSFVDDCFIGGRAGLSRARSIAAELRELPQRRGFSIMLRVRDVLLPGATEALLSLQTAGLGSIFLGIDGCSDEDLRRFGKRFSMEEGRDAVRRLAAMSLPTVIGAILFHDRSTRASVLRGLDYLDELMNIHPMLTFNFLSHLVCFEGTPLHRQHPIPNASKCMSSALSAVGRIWATEYHRLVGSVIDASRRRFPSSIRQPVRRAVAMWQIQTLRRMVSQSRCPDATTAASDCLGLFSFVAAEAGLAPASNLAIGGPVEARHQELEVVCDVD